MKKIINYFIYTKWRPIRYCWPYPEGYGIYRKHRITGIKTVLDTHRTKKDAQDACDIENNRR